MRKGQNIQSIPLFKSLAFKIPLTFIMMLLVFLATFITVMELRGKPLIIEMSNRQVIQTGESIVTQLGERIRLTESLVTAMANAGEALPKNDQSYKDVIRNIVNYEGTENFVAGGGIWPEPFQFDKNKARNSYFWGRERDNSLTFYDDYNDPSGNGYHNEEWYVPAQYLKPGAIYWSKSYMDPYSYQSMVTATAPMFRNNRYYGATTIDLKLEGLSELLAYEANKFGGYAYALDRNGTFLSFPNETFTKTYSVDEQGKKTEEYKNIADLVSNSAYFDQIHQALNRLSTAQEPSLKIREQANMIAAQSYQIDIIEATRIAKMLNNPLADKEVGNTLLTQLQLTTDPILQQPVIANIFHVPSTHWKVITVTPLAHAYATPKEIVSSVFNASIILLTLSLAIGFFMMRKFIISPLLNMTGQIKDMDLDTISQTHSPAIQGIEHGELGALARQFNDHTQQLVIANSKLAKQIELTEQAAKAKSQFLANMSHEIRTPINGVLGMLTLLEHTDLEKQQLHYVATATTSAESLLTVINDILDYSKIEAGKLDIEIIDFDLRSHLNDFANSMAHLAQTKGLELVLDINQVPHQMVKGDPGRIRQVLTNLVSNAIKFTEQGEVVIRIKLENAGQAGLILYGSVKDTGIGIPEEKQQNLFQSFSQIDASNTRKYGGTGLGLAICKQLCELMGGGITLHSKEGKGSQFDFVVTLKDSDTSIPEMPSIDIHNVPILIVDDNHTNREVLRGQLEHWGAKVTEADSGHNALRILEESAFSIAILDMQMPIMNGAALGNAIRANHRYDSMQLIMMTSIGERGDASYFARLGFAAYFPKPTSTSDLYAALKIVFDNGEALEAAKPLLTHHNILSIKRATKKKEARILLVEDNTINQLVATGILETLGYGADVAENGQIAVNKFIENEKTDPYHLILMDCQMPVMDGYEATRYIRNPEHRLENPKIPILAMTANAMKGDMEACLEAGMDDYLSKPITPEILEEKLNKWLFEQPKGGITLDLEPPE